MEMRKRRWYARGGNQVQELGHHVSGGQPISGPNECISTNCVVLPEPKYLFEAVCAILIIWAVEDPARKIPLGVARILC